MNERNKVSAVAEKLNNIQTMFHAYENLAFSLFVDYYIFILKKKNLAWARTRT